MHYHAECWFPFDPTDDLEEAVHALMRPFDENGPEAQARIWDWYQIGGRWRGHHDPSYDINSDPTCSGVWPTQFKLHEADCMRVIECPDDLTAHTLFIYDDGEWNDHTAYQKQVWDGASEQFLDGPFDGNVQNKLEELGLEPECDGWLVTVDYHS
jgi:hypothetical protein